MANGQTTAPTKSELQDTIDEVCDLLDEALDPELSREEVIAKVKDAYNLASGEGDEDEEDDEEEEYDQD
jgi:phage-related protein